MLSSELDQMRNDISDLLPDTATILSVSRVSDGQGGFTDSWGTVTTYSCRVDAAASSGISNFQGNEVVRGGAVQAYGRWVATLPYNATVSAENRLECNGRTFNIIAEDNDKSWPLNIRVIMEQV